MSMWSYAVIAGVVAGAAASALAGDISQVNAFRTETRIFNDFASSNLDVGNIGGPFTNCPTNPMGPQPVVAVPRAGGLQIRDQYGVGAMGNFANKHVGWLSTDGGATRYGHAAIQSFDISFTVSINAPAAAPRKEAGIEVRNPRPALGYVDEGQLLIASDGEVAVFGGVMPFYSSNVFGGGPWYTVNTTAQVTFRYFAPGVADPILGGYQILFNDAMTGMHDSGIRLWGAMEPDGTRGFNGGTEFGLKAQNQRNPFINEFGDTRYGGVQIVPTPGAMALLGLAGLAATRRRR